jgi:hypothetical protein
MGYTYGKWNNQYVCDYASMRTRTIDKLIYRGVFAEVVWNNVRHEYKEGKSAVFPYKQHMIRKGVNVYKQLVLFEPIYFRKKSRKDNEQSSR